MERKISYASFSMGQLGKWRLWRAGRGLILGSGEGLDFQIADRPGIFIWDYAESHPYNPFTEPAGALSGLGQLLSRGWRYSPYVCITNWMRYEFSSPLGQPSRSSKRIMNSLHPHLSKPLLTLTGTPVVRKWWK